MEFAHPEMHIVYERSTVKSGVFGMQNFVTVYCRASIVIQLVKLKEKCKFYQGYYYGITFVISKIHPLAEITFE